jgi:hypothetical protein
MDPLEQMFITLLRRLFIIAVATGLGWLILRWLLKRQAKADDKKE